MYIVPQQYKCSLCGFECEYSPHHHFPAPTIGDFIGCPRCWEKFLREKIGCMEMVHKPKTPDNIRK